MIQERMIELLLLNQYLSVYDECLTEECKEMYRQCGYDIDSILSRREGLLCEFLKPYVIDNAPKGD